jgi:protein-S-isoprenylcysteine O-methyltransferase Ste14
VLGLFTRPVALIAFAFLGSLWVSELGTSWIWELLVSVMACLAVSVGSAGRTWGVDAILARKNPSSLLW